MNTLLNEVSLDETSPSGLRWNTGKVAGCLRNDGYWRLRFKGKMYYNHRIVAILSGNLKDYYDSLEIDHIDGNRGNNSVDNLRVVTRQTNNTNLYCHRDGKLVGATYIPRKRHWQARITIKGKRTSLGYYRTEKEAHEAYVNKYEELYGKRP